MGNESIFLNDLRGCSFEEWVAFAFDRPVPAAVGDKIDIDHVPSFGAQKKALEKALGRPLDPAEEKQLRKTSPTVAVPERAHEQDSRTTGQGKEQIEKEAKDLSAAADKDIDTYKKAGTFSEEESEKIRSQVKEHLEKQQKEMESEQENQ